MCDDLDFVLLLFCAVPDFLLESFDRFHIATLPVDFATQLSDLGF